MFDEFMAFLLNKSGTIIINIMLFLNITYPNMKQHSVSTLIIIRNVAYTSSY